MEADEKKKNKAVSALTHRLKNSLLFRRTKARAVQTKRFGTSEKIEN